MKFENIHDIDKVFKIGKRTQTFMMSGYGSNQKEQDMSTIFENHLIGLKIAYKVSIQRF